MPPKPKIQKLNKKNDKKEKKGKNAKGPPKPAATKGKDGKGPPKPEATKEDIGKDLIAKPSSKKLTAFAMDTYIEDVRRDTALTKTESDISVFRDDEKIPIIKTEPKPEKKIAVVEVEDPLAKVIEDIDLEEASTESSDDEDVYYKRKRQKSFFVDADTIFGATTDLVLDVNEDVDELAEEEEEEHETTDETGLEYLKQHELKEEVDFFNKITDAPDIDQISLDLSIEKPRPRRKKRDWTFGDAGIFVDPLTGEIINLHESTDEEERIEQERRKKRAAAEERRLAAEARLRQEEEKFVAPESGSEVSIDIPLFSEQEEDEEILGIQKPAGEDTLTAFLGLDAPKGTEVEIDIEALLREENARILLNQTHEFVQWLINQAVETAEYVDPTTILRQNLDKRKLLKELRDKLQSLEYDRKVKQFLNRKCVEYFRRKRTFRPIMEDNPRTLSHEFKKYQAAVSNLDYWLIKEEEASAHSANTLYVTREELDVEEERTEEKVKELEEIIRTTLKRENFDKLQHLVADTLTKMARMRKEISTVRLQLIQKQHNMATLVEQLRDLEDLGNGLSMRNFESVQTEAQALGKKIEERNAELNKLRQRCHGDIHRLAHLKEKQKTLRETISYQRRYMDRLQTEKQDLREYLFELKLQRNRLRTDIRETSFQSGLLDKPVLMRDFDVTTDHLRDLKQRVAEHQETVNDLNEKISILEKCAANG